MAYTRQQLQDLWVQAGGNPAYASMASAVALAESGGNPNSSNTNRNGTIDRGLWQINSIHGSLSTFDVMGNARAAVSISKNGTNWRPWCTAWSDGRCGGTFMGTGSPVLNFLTGGGSVTSPSGDSQSQQTLQFQNTGLTNPLSPQAWADAFLKPVAVSAYYFLMYVSGMVLIVIGIILLIWDTSFGKWAKGTIQDKWKLIKPVKAADNG